MRQGVRPHLYGILSYEREMTTTTSTSTVFSNQPPPPPPVDDDDEGESCAICHLCSLLLYSFRFVLFSFFIYLCFIL